MPIVGPKDKSFIARLKERDTTVMDTEEAAEREIRALHVGVLNMMPDAVLKATEDQFLIPLQHSTTTLQVIPHFVSIRGIERQGEAAEYVAEQYEPFEQVREEGLDGLIITGANLPNPDLRKNGFWEPLTEVIDWAEENVTSTLYSCLATHAYMLHTHNIQRQPLGAKRWGVFEHDVVNPDHPLTRGMDSVLAIPHSRWNEVTADQFRRAGMRILVQSDEAGVHMVTSRDGLRMVGWQGHPEYDTISLLKEWERDLGLYADGDLKQQPPYPAHYLRGNGLRLAEEFRLRVEQGEYYNIIKKGQMPPEIEQAVVSVTPNRWNSACRTLLSNWVGAILDKTHVDRTKPFMNGVNPDNPFNLPYDPDLN